MNRPPLRTALTFLLPPLEPRVRDMVVDARTQTASNFALDFAELRQHRLLCFRRIKPREIPRRGEHTWRVARAGRVRRSSRATWGRRARGRLSATGNMRSA